MAVNLHGVLTHHWRVTVLKKKITKGKKRLYLTLMMYFRETVKWSKGHPEDYVPDFFKRPFYILTHSEVVYPVPGQHDWVKTPEPDIDPPVFLVHPGRRKKNRRRGPDEKDEPRGKGTLTYVRCSNCKKQGHRYTTCALPLKPHLAIRKAKHKTTRRSPEDVATASASAAAPTNAAATAGNAGPAIKSSAGSVRTSPRLVARRAATASTSMPTATAPTPMPAPTTTSSMPAAAVPGGRFKPPRPKSTAPASSAPPVAAPSTRPTRRNAGKMPSRFNENAEVGQSSRRKFTPARGRGRGGQPKRSRIMEYFSCSRPENAEE